MSEMDKAKVAEEHYGSGHWKASDSKAKIDNGIRFLYKAAKEIREIKLGRKIVFDS